MTAPTVLTPQMLAAVDKAVGWPQADIAQIVAIQENQSGGHTDEVGWNYGGHTVADTTGTTPPPPGLSWDSYDVGISQIDSVHSPGGTGTFQPGWVAQMENPIANARAALAVFRSQGWPAWAGDPSFQGVNLPAGQQAAAAVAPYSQAKLDRVFSSGGSLPFPGGSYDPLNWQTEALGAAGGAVGGAVKNAVGGAVSSLGGTILKYVLYGVVAVAGVAGIGVALRDAGSHGGDSGHPVEKDLAMGAAA